MIVTEPGKIEPEVRVGSLVHRECHGESLALLRSGLHPTLDLVVYVMRQGNMSDRPLTLHDGDGVGQVSGRAGIVGLGRVGSAGTVEIVHCDGVNPATELLNTGDTLFASRT